MSYAQPVSSVISLVVSGDTASPSPFLVTVVFCMQFASTFSSSESDAVCAGGRRADVTLAQEAAELGAGVAAAAEVLVLPHHLNHSWVLLVI